MTISNLPTIAQIGEDPTIVSNLPLDTLRAIIDTADDAAKSAAFAKRACVNTVSDRLTAEIAQAYVAKGVDTGMIHIDRDGLDVQVDRSKTVTWDQAKLAASVEAIRAGGDDPAEYVKTAYSVSEAAYAAWPSMIRKVFEPARTVKPGNPTIKLAEKLEGAA